MATTEKQTFTGKVIKANDSGVIIDTMPDVWLNKSSRGDAAALTLPQVGQTVSIEATPWKDRLYIQSIAVNGTGTTSHTAAHHAPESAHDAQETSQEPDRERRIARMACLNTATALLSHNVPVGECIRAEVLEALAARLESWVYRGL